MNEGLDGLKRDGVGFLQIEHLGDEAFHLFALAGWQIGQELQNVLLLLPLASFFVAAVVGVVERGGAADCEYVQDVLEGAPTALRVNKSFTHGHTQRPTHHTLGRAWLGWPNRPPLGLAEQARPEETAIAGPHRLPGMRIAGGWMQPVGALEPTLNLLGVAMTELIDPEHLRSLTDLGQQYGLDGEHLRQVAVAGRLKAWRVGHTWITTAAHLEAYLASRRPAGRKPKAKTKAARNR